MTFALWILIALTIWNQWATHQQTKLTERIEMNQAEAVAKLNSVNDSLTKIGGETSTLLAKVADLEAAAANAGEISPELQAAIEAVSAQATKVDDLVPDSTPPTA